MKRTMWLVAALGSLLLSPAMTFATGADVNAKNSSGESVLRLAKRLNNKEITDALEARGALDVGPTQPTRGPAFKKPTAAIS